MPIEESMDGGNLTEVYNRTREAADALYAKASEIHGLTSRTEELTKDTPAWYAGTRARVEARAAVEQVEELRRVLEEWGGRLRGGEV